MGDGARRFATDTTEAAIAGARVVAPVTGAGLAGPGRG